MYFRLVLHTTQNRQSGTSVKNSLEDILDDVGRFHDVELISVELLEVALIVLHGRLYTAVVQTSYRLL